MKIIIKVIKVFSEKLNHLFETRTKPDGSPVTHKEIHQATGMSLGAISGLRTGSVENPTLRIIEMFANFFGVEPNYFFGESSQKDVQLEQLVFHASKLSNESKQSLIAITVELVELEKRLKNTEDLNTPDQ